MMSKILVTLCLLLVLAASGCISPDLGTGKLVLQVTDKPGIDIEKAEVTISNIEVHMASSGDNSSAGWKMVVEQPQTFDLIAIKDVKEVLGEQNLEAGRYTQIRLNVDSAIVTINGTVHNLTISSKTVKLVHSFEISGGETTTLTLDFDAGDSIHEAGMDKYIMRPTIMVITEKPSGEKTAEEKCEESGGTVTTSVCCLSTEDFPNLCPPGPCGCAPDQSHEIQVCDCGEDRCFNGNKCVDREEPEDVSCVTPNGSSMMLSEARQIAEGSDCVENGTISDIYQCNSDTGTWWIDLDIEAPGCNPACVINISSGEAEINWRCTGA